VAGGPVDVPAGTSLGAAGEYRDDRSARVPARRGYIKGEFRFADTQTFYVEGKLKRTETGGDEFTYVFTRCK